MNDVWGGFGRCAVTPGTELCRREDAERLYAVLQRDDRGSSLSEETRDRFKTA
jgi:hypothetical protein